MRKLLPFTLLFLAACSASSLFGGGDGAPHLSSKWVREKSGGVSIDVEYPWVDTGLTADIASDVNHRLFLLADATIAAFRRDVRSPEIAVHSSVSTLSMRIEPSLVTQDILSLSMPVTSSLAGAAHENTYRLFFNYDVRGRIPFSLTDLLTDAPAGFKTLSESVTREMADRARAGGAPDNEWIQLLKEQTPLEPETPQTFTIEHGDLVLWFEPGRMAPIAQGEQQVRISFATLSPLLNERGKKLLAL